MILDKSQKNIINSEIKVSSDEQNNLNLRVNVNNYNLQCYVGENKIDKFLQNMKLKNSEQMNEKINRINLRNKILRPYSSNNQPSQLTNINKSEDKRDLSLINDSLIQNNNLFEIQTPFRNLFFGQILRDAKRRKTSSFFQSDFNLSNSQKSSFRKSNFRRKSKIKKSNGSKKIIYKVNEKRRKSIIKRGSMSPIKKMKSLPSSQFKLTEINSSEKEKSYKNNNSPEQSDFKSNERRRSNPDNRNSISSLILNESKLNKKKNCFKRKFGSFYEKIKIKKVKTNDNEYLNLVDDIKFKNNKIDEKVNDEVGPVQKKFLKKQLSNVHSKILEIQQNKNNIYKKSFYNKIKEFYIDLNKKGKLILNQEYNSFEGKDNTLNNIFKSFFFQINMIELDKFLRIVYKLIYSPKTKRRILRSFYTVAFRFLMDKYLNPRKGMLTLIFRFGIERKTSITKPTRKLNNIKSNKINIPITNYNKNISKRNVIFNYQTYNKIDYNTTNNINFNTRYNNSTNNTYYNTRYNNTTNNTYYNTRYNNTTNNTYYNTSNNSNNNSNTNSNNNSYYNTSNNTNNNSYYNINNNSNNNNINRNYSKLVNNFNNNYNLKDSNFTNLVKKINNNLFLEKKALLEKNNLIKLGELLEKSKQHLQNKFYINEFILNDTIFDILRTNIIIPKHKKYLKFFIKEKTKKPSVMRNSIKKGFNNIFSTKNILLDQMLKEHPERKRKRKKTIKKKFRNDIQISNNLFSTSNQEVTKIKTELLRALKLKGIENNLYKVIFYHIQEDNFVLVKKVINDNYGFINMNYKDEKGNTFLNIAVKYNCKKEIIQFLLINGCNPNIGNVNNIFFIFYRMKVIVLYIMLYHIKIFKLQIYYYIMVLMSL